MLGITEVTWVETSVFISRGCCNKILPSGWLRAIGIYSLQFWKLDLSSPGITRAPFWKLWGRIYSMPFSLLGATNNP